MSHAPREPSIKEDEDEQNNIDSTTINSTLNTSLIANSTICYNYFIIFNYF